METCIESPAFVARDAGPSWTTRFARPDGDGFRMVEELRGVPKAALRSIFGKTFGGRIWMRTRDRAVHRMAADARREVSDREVREGLVKYLSKQAAATLEAKGRLAVFVELKIAYEDGEVISVGGLLERPTFTAGEICEAAIGMLERVPARCSIAKSMNLSTRTIATGMTVDEEQLPAMWMETDEPQNSAPLQHHPEIKVCRRPLAKT
jgi:hypothetical protein